MTAYRPNERICPICGNPYRIYGRITCRECDEQVDWLGKPTFVECPPGTIYLRDENTRRRDT